MPKLLHARAPQDAAEEHKVRKLANSRHAPSDWIMRARMIGPQLGWASHHVNRPRTGVPPSDGTRALPSLQRLRDRWTRRSSRSRAQAENNRARTLQDHRSGLQGATWEVAHRIRRPDACRG
jgi:hypothetical protein